MSFASQARYGGADPHGTFMAAVDTWCDQRPGAPGHFGTVPLPTLRRGSRGAAVRQWQQFLNATGFAVTVDGNFGPATAAATRSFQASRGLDPDGVVGTATQEARASIARQTMALFDPAPPTPQPGLDPAGYIGSKGPVIRCPDGSFGFQEDCPSPWATPLLDRLTPPVSPLFTPPAQQHQPTPPPWTMEQPRPPT